MRLIPFIWNFDSRRQAIFAKRATLSVSKKCSTNVGSFDLLHNTILIPVTSLIECLSLVSFLDERVRQISRTIVSSRLGTQHLFLQHDTHKAILVESYFVMHWNLWKKLFFSSKAMASEPRATLYCSVVWNAGEAIPWKFKLSALTSMTKSV